MDVLPLVVAVIALGIAVGSCLVTLHYARAAERSAQRAEDARDRGAAALARVRDLRRRDAGDD